MEMPGRKLWIFPPLSEPGLPSLGCPGNSVSKESACNAKDPGLIPGSGRSSEEGNGDPFQYSRLENPMDRVTSMGLRLWGWTQWGGLEKGLPPNCCRFLALAWVRSSSSWWLWKRRWGGWPVGRVGRVTTEGWPRSRVEVRAGALAAHC